MFKLTQNYKKLFLSFIKNDFNNLGNKLLDDFEEELLNMQIYYNSIEIAIENI